MLADQKWMKLSKYIEYDIAQALDERKDLTSLQPLIERIRALDISAPEREPLCRELSEQLLALTSPTEPEEPSDLRSIQKLRPLSEPSKLVREEITSEALYDRIYGAWLGRCCGCLLGKPVECWPRSKIEAFLNDTGQYPLSYYFSSDICDEIKEKYGIQSLNFQYHGYINNTAYMPEDDDTNYTILALKLVKERGVDFTMDDVGEHWLSSMAILHLCTAERVAYANLCGALYPPETATFHNPYREWIGAQIRGDLYGYVAPFHPEKAAAMAFTDAAISHVRNGIYGEMFVAAMLSAAFGLSDIESIIRCGLAQIPENCRLAQKIRLVMDWAREGISAREAIDRVHRLYDEATNHHWCHTISNAMIVCIALLFGGQDFERTICIAVEAGFDTDCNGATAGSVLGLLKGAAALPLKWTEPLHDRVISSIEGFTDSKISSLARISSDLAMRFLESRR